MNTNAHAENLVPPKNGESSQNYVHLQRFLSRNQKLYDEMVNESLMCNEQWKEQTKLIKDYSIELKEMEKKNKEMLAFDKELDQMMTGLNLRFEKQFEHKKKHFECDHNIYKRLIFYVIN